MKQTFSEQLSVWRTANGVATMKDVLHENTSIVKDKEGNKYKVIRPHGLIKTKDSKVLGMYVKYKLATFKIIEQLKIAVEQENEKLFNELKAKHSQHTRKFYNALREGTGYENVLAINHQEAITVELDEKVLNIHIYPIKSNGRIYNFDIVTFKDDEGNDYNMPCIIEKVEKKKKKGARKK